MLTNVARVMCPHLCTCHTTLKSVCMEMVLSHLPLGFGALRCPVLRIENYINFSVSSQQAALSWLNLHQVDEEGRVDCHVHELRLDKSA